MLKNNVDIKKIFDDNRNALEKGCGIRIKNLDTENPEVEIITPDEKLKILSCSRNRDQEAPKT